MKKTWFAKALLASATFALVAGLTPATAAPNEDGTNMLVVGKNYYQDPNISKGFLGTVINVHVEKLTQSAAAGDIVFNEGITYNDFYLANNISPEDNYSGYLNKTNSAGKLINSNPTKYGNLTYVGPASTEKLAINHPKVPNLFNPVLFSRLTVGGLPVQNGTTDYMFGTYGDNPHFPDLIGYGEASTVNDYMLTPENDFVIPTRFNTKRNDVWLTMRGNAPDWGMRGAQAYLTAFDETGAKVEGKAQDPKFYINTTSKIYLTPTGFNRLGDFGKVAFRANIGQANAQLTDLGVNEFANTINPALRQIQNISGAQTIPAGFGGQIQLTGFYRKTPIDNDYKASEQARLDDHKHKVNATYFMYTSGDTIKGADNPAFPDVPQEYHANIPNVDTSKVLKMYSPNASVYKLVTTRPFFKEFGNLNEVRKYEDVKADFEDKLGLQSFKVEENGYAPDGTKLAYDESRIRVRIGQDAYTLEELQKVLETDKYTGKTIELVYTYAGTDADNSIIGKLPTEIVDELGAYAVPIIRTIQMPEKKTPEKPNKPVEPEKPNKPVEPEKPNKPVEPEKPNKPVEPTKPATPNKGGKVVLVKKPNLANTGISNGMTTMMVVLSLAAVGVIAVSIRKKNI